jgi:hypothetical protein
VSIFDVFQDSGPFIRREINDFLKGYYRNLMQSQPNHVEIVGEKNTVAGLIVAGFTKSRHVTRDRLRPR